MATRTRPNRHRTRLWLSSLEDRAVPAVYNVNSISNSGAGTLRQAIINANLNPGLDSITFSPATFASAQTILLQSALSITDSLTMVGPGSGKVNVRRDAGAGNFRVLSIGNTNALLNVNVSGITISNGNHIALQDSPGPPIHQTDNGGGLYVGSEEVTLTDVVVTGNTSNAQGGGIGVDDSGRLTLINCTISGNTALGLVNGAQGTSPLFSGVGGGVYMTVDGSLNIMGSTISGNSAKYSGAGVFFYADTIATALISNSTIANNKITNNYSGAFYKSGGGGIAALTNIATGGVANITLRNSTIYQNTGGTGNTGGGILATYAASIVAESSIISGNTATNAPDIQSTQKVTMNNSAVGSANGHSTVGTTSSGNLAHNTNLLLGSLADNGGLTQTVLPALTSPVVDAGSNTSLNSTDQRGQARFFDQNAGGGTVDIGAAEYMPAGTGLALAFAANVASGNATSHNIVVTFSDSDGIDVGTLGTGDITVINSKGFSDTATFSGVDNGSPRVATYTFTPPGNSWDVTDDDLYTVTLNAGQVTDTKTNAIPSGPIGTFKVIFPRNLLVSNKMDTGVGSLRQAIADSNALFPSQDSISFSSFFNNAATISLNAGQMSLSDSVKIIGPGQGQVNLTAKNKSRHLMIDGPGVIDVEISGMTFSDGQTKQNSQSQRGGSIFNRGEVLTLDGVVFDGNKASDSYGGAIWVGGQGVLTAKNSSFRSNSAPGSSGASSYGGGAIAAFEFGHVIDIQDSGFSNNSAYQFGGAIYANNGSVSIARSYFSGNTTTAAPAGGGGAGGGGAMMIGDGFHTTSLLISDSTFESNSTAGAGGAMFVQFPTPGFVVQNSTFAYNSAPNTASNVAGAIIVGSGDGIQAGTITFDHCTITGNQAFAAGGLFVANDMPEGRVILQSTIIALNEVADPGNPVDVDGKFTAFDSLIGALDGGGLSDDSENVQVGTIDLPLDPEFGFYDYHGGPTPCFELMPSSPAIDTGAKTSSLAYDQRGPGFNRVGGIASDIGSFEFQAATPPDVVSVITDDGTLQRSVVRSMTVTFTSLVNLGSGTPENAFKLARLGPTGATGDVALSVDTATLSTPTQTVALITFTGPFTEGADSLIDGNYRLTVIGVEVEDASNLLLMTSNSNTDLFRLFGDVDGNRLIDLLDFGSFRTSFFSTTNLIFDFDGSGVIDLPDFGEFRVQYGMTLAP